MANAVNVGNSSVAWCLERKIPVGRRPLGFGGSLRRSSFSGDEEQTPSLYLPHPPGVERDRSLNSGNFIFNPSGRRSCSVLHIDVPGYLEKNRLGLLEFI